MVKRDFYSKHYFSLNCYFSDILVEDFLSFSTFKVHEDAANSYLSNGDVVVVNRNREPRYKDFIVTRRWYFYISRVVATAGQV